MTLLALLIGLLVERLATQLFHLRRLRWLEGLIDSGFRVGQKLGRWPALISVIGIAILLILPVLIVLVLLQDAFYGIADLVFSVFVLFFSLGPKDIGEDVDDYCRAIEAGDENEIEHTSKALIEKEVPADPLQRIFKVEEAVCVQANNRLFAVVFWFVAFGPLGPLGAWAYRVTDLIRRRAVFNAVRDVDASSTIVKAAEQVHGWLVWIPARLTAIGYALAGSFDNALSAWRRSPTVPPATLGESSEHLLARVGVGALALDEIVGETIPERGVRGAMAANGLVYRLFFIWAAAIGAMTLYGLSV